MARSANQKLKPLYIARILSEKTDELHPITMEEIIKFLNGYGIEAERKSIYDDIDALKNFGMDIVCIKGRKGGYFVASRQFELAELKLMVDAVQSSKFITAKKSAQLIKKLESFVSCYDAQKLQRQVFIFNRIKSMNESIYYLIDSIHTAILDDKKISFKYFEYTVDKEKQYKKDGEKYVISPFSLVWEDENYYMRGFDGEADLIKNYRVDKMSNVSVCDEKREGKELFATEDKNYSAKTFSMFGGEEKRVRIRFENSLAGVVIDRFGKDIPFIKADDEHFDISVNVMVSPLFFGWLAAFSNRVRLLEPEQVRKEYINHIKAIME